MGLLLIGVAAWGKGFGIVSSIHLIGGVIAVGVFLLLIAIVGLVGAVHHHQVMLFFVSFHFFWGGGLLYVTPPPLALWCPQTLSWCPQTSSWGTLGGEWGGAGYPGMDLALLWK